MSGTNVDVEALARQDRAGIFASALCAVHCAVGAIAAGSSSLGAMLTDESVELAFFGIAIAIALVALVRGYRMHHRAEPLLLAVVALVPLALARGRAWDAHSVEAMLSIVGAAGLVCAHALNLVRTRQRCAC